GGGGGGRGGGGGEVGGVADQRGPRGDGAGGADPADRAGHGGRGGRDGHAVPALPSLPRRLAAEAREDDGEEVRPADHPPLAARRRRRRLLRVRAEVQAARRAGRSGRREALGLTSRLGTGFAAVAGVATGGIAWGLYEAQWVRLTELRVALPGLPPELEGLRLAHRPDVQFGVPSPALRALGRAVDWVAERQPDLVLVTGDLLSRPGGDERLRRLIARLPPVYAVLGNHDFADSRDPFSKPVGEVDLGRGTLLSDGSVTLELRGRRVQLVGVDPRTYMRREAQPWELAEPDADLRILLCHFPRVVDLLPEGSFDLVLSGHMHDGQICLPYGRGKLRIAHPRAPYNRGIYHRAGAVLHVSAGLGTTFVPFRFFARPEATELVLQSA